MKTWHHSLLTWLPGPATALVGVIGVRWVAPCFAGRAQASIIVVGYLLVPLGLFWFASRLGRRAAQRTAAIPSSMPPRGTGTYPDDPTDIHPPD